MYLECREGFFSYIMDLFYQAGHVATLNPEYANHSAEQFVYTVTRNDLYLSRDQRGMLKCFGDISRLFTSHDCSFFSVNLSTLPRDRILLYKRLTEKRFQWPRSEKDLKKLTLQEFRWLMEGLSITQRKAFVPGKPGTVC